MNRTDWLEWRHQGIGSSDAAVLHGITEYGRTPLTLYNEKIGPVIDRPSTFIQQKGNTLEPSGRQYMNEVLSNMFFRDVRLEPKMFVLDGAEFMRASLDGFVEVDEKRIGVEIKYTGKNHEKIPRKYWIQIQHQYLVAGLDIQYYVRIIDENNFTHELIPKDEEFLRMHLEVCSKFWRHRLKFEPPDIVDADWKTVSVNKKLTDRWVWIKDKIKEYEREQKTIEKELITLSGGHARIIANDLRFQEIERKGSVDYSAIPELKSVDLEKYRKPSTKYWQFAKKETE